MIWGRPLPMLELLTNEPPTLELRDPKLGIRAGSAKGGACASFGSNGALRWGNEFLWENLNLFRSYGSPDGTDIVIVSPGEITAQPGRKWQKTAGSCNGMQLALQACNAMVA